MAKSKTLDQAYFKKNLERTLSMLDSLTPAEMSRTLLRLAAVADEKVLCEPEFASITRRTSTPTHYYVLSYERYFGMRGDKGLVQWVFLKRPTLKQAVDFVEHTLDTTCNRSIHVSRVKFSEPLKKKKVKRESDNKRRKL